MDSDQLEQVGFPDVVRMGKIPSFFVGFFFLNSGGKGSCVDLFTDF